MSRTPGDVYDVIVIGGGPSGMMAAGRAGARGLRVLLIEKNAVLGKKLSVTGGGRCNITNAEFVSRILLANYGEAAKFLYSPFSQFGVQDTFDFFTERGLPLVVEDRKRAFPECHSAPRVTQVMETFVRGSGVEVLLDTPVIKLECVNGVLSQVYTNKGVFSATSVIIATGGLSHSDTGSTGDGLEWLRDLGHTVHAVTPDVVPLRVHEAWVHALAGKSLEHMTITFGTGAHKVVRTGKILFTHFGISGPLILNAAHEVKKLLGQGPVTTTINLFPGTDEGTLDARIIRHFDLHKNKMLKNALQDLLPPGMTDVVLGMLGKFGIGETKIHSITKDMRAEILHACRGLTMTVIGTMGYDWAVISDGGIDLTEVNTRTMSSKIYPNLYFTGDILNINRPSGGFSLQLCWTTGWVAGNSVT